MENQIISLADVTKMAAVISQSNFFGVKTQAQALALMLVAQAEGRHPASVAMDYHVIDGKPALKADAMLSRYFSAGGKVKWLSMTDKKCEAVFSHPSSGEVTISWDEARAKAAGLLDKKGGMFLKYPRPMYRARVISEGVRASFPGVIGGFYTPEEVEFFAPEPKGTQTVINEKPLQNTKEEVKPSEPKAKSEPIEAEEDRRLAREARLSINARVKIAIHKIGWEKNDLDAHVSVMPEAWPTWEKVPNDRAENICEYLEREAAEQDEKK